MAIILRDLLARVHQYRPDLLEGQSLWALQETARDVAKYTGICQTTQVPHVLTNNTSKLTITPDDTTETIIRVLRIRIASIPQNLSLSGVQYLGTWNASTNTPSIASGSASSANLYQFYIVTVAGTTTVDSETTFNVGDVLYSTGTAWKKIKLEEYLTSQETNSPSVNLDISRPQSSPGFPNYWAQEQGVVFFYAPPKNDLSMELTLSVVPSRSQLIDDNAPWTFPMEVEDCLVYGAMETLLRLPGAGQNLNMAEGWRIRYLKERANIRTIAILGNGSAWIQPGNFTGRQGRISPWRSDNRWL
jgi:hypothetical protein